MATAHLNALERRPFQWHNCERRFPPGQYPALLRPLARLRKNVRASAAIGHQNRDVLIEWSRFRRFPHSHQIPKQLVNHCPYNEVGYETLRPEAPSSTVAWSCPLKWCSAVEFTEIAGMSRVGQLAIAGRLTAGSSRMGAMVM
jgi:hypothetical protein